MHADGLDSSSLTRMSLSPPQLRVTAHRTSFFFFFFPNGSVSATGLNGLELLPRNLSQVHRGGDYLSIPPCTTHSKYGHCFQCFSLYRCHLSHLSPPLPLLCGQLLCWCSCPLLMPKEKWPWSKSDGRNRCAPLLLHTHTHSPPPPPRLSTMHLIL